MNILEIAGILFFAEVFALAIVYMLGGLNAELVLGKKSYKIGG